MSYQVTIGHLYPELLNLYSDKGNIAALKKRLEWRGIGVTVKEIPLEETIDFSSLDLVLLGGGSDRELSLVCERLKEQKAALWNYIESGGVLLALCGGFQMLGKQFVLHGTPAEGLGLFDFTTEHHTERLMGKVVLQSGLTEDPIVGFENHSGRTQLKELLPLGITTYGIGNNGKDKTEGFVYQNTIGSSLCGPLLPPNPQLTDWLLNQSLQQKYGNDAPTLTPLDDSMEADARNYIVQKYCK